MSIKDWNTFEDIRADIMAWIICILIGWFFGWIHAHSTVASECEKLGSFYVGSKVFHCAKIEARQ